MKPAIKVENLSKQYRLGNVGTGSFGHDINRWWHSVRGKEDPYLKIGESNDRTTKGESDYVWALKDVNFTLQPGEVLGIIGKNGAGKSTLLKLLSRVTLPSTGSIKARGRIASLLEVGTGFHPELTGRENVFLNGAIMGMTKTEIRAKFDEIVAFAGCERYIDTPVKRYSSGMYVRLAFAVAAHLEPEILIVDEVLAVGDAEFQKKAIEKMKDVSKGGKRTVLFVSHNMASVKALCTKGLVMQNGTTVFSGDVDDSINYYLRKDVKDNHASLKDIKQRGGNSKLMFSEIKLLNKEKVEITNAILGGYTIFSLKLESTQVVNNLEIRIQIIDSFGNIVSTLNNFHSADLFQNINNDAVVNCVFENMPLLPGEYTLSLRARDQINKVLFDELESCYLFKVESGDYFGTGRIPIVKQGVVINHKWEI
ncbi:ABC transporter ATP-binding protein [Formosa sp. 3Alg 14/1]|uniref:ABC transporter ATP-binding protein n=1 Tax=Formosa sp. 3Alg 14/1 TaxID=3382190 RepID=UPI0039BE3535